MSEKDHIQIPIHIQQVMDVWNKLKPKGLNVPDAIAFALKEFLEKYDETETFLAVTNTVLQPQCLVQYASMPGHHEQIRYFTHVEKWTGGPMETIKGTYLRPYDQPTHNCCEVIRDAVVGELVVCKKR